MKNEILYQMLLIWYIGSLFVNIASGIYAEYQFSMGGILYYTFVIYLFIHPFKYLNLKKTYTFEIPPAKYLVYLGVFLIFLSFVNIFSNIGQAFTAYQELDYQAFRVEIQNNPESSSHGFFSIISSFSSSLFFISVTVFFASIVLNYSKIFIFLIFFSSLSVLISNMATLSRQASIIWSVCVIFNYVIFSLWKNNHNVSTKLKKIKKHVAPIVILSFMFFTVVTINRFTPDSILYFEDHGSKTKRTPITGVFSYYAQSVVNFDIFYNQNYTDYSYGSTIFPLYDRTLSFLGLKENNLEDIYHSRRVFAPYHWYNFSTLLRGLWSDFGPIGSLIIALIYSYLLSTWFKRSFNTLSIKKIVILFYLFKIPLMGLFNLPIFTMSENFAIAILIFMPSYKTRRYIKNND